MNVNISVSNMNSDFTIFWIPIQLVPKKQCSNLVFEKYFIFYVSGKKPMTMLSHIFLLICENFEF